MKRPLALGVVLAAALAPALCLASSHREAPNIASLPKVDGTDLYLFRSYEPGRQGFVTLIANYIPLQDPAGGPNFYEMDPQAIYGINIDNTGTAIPSMSFQFRFTNTLQGLAVSAGGEKVAVPQLNLSPVDKDGKALNVRESYTLSVHWNNGQSRASAQNLSLGGTTFFKPVDNIGEKSIADYAAYAANFVYDVALPNCATPGRVFVGQRKEGFVVNLGEIFDLVNTNPVGPRDGEPNTLSHKNVTTIALELPTACLTHGKDPVIGAWTTASIPQSHTTGDNLGTEGNWIGSDGRALTQVSRLGNPLINEVIIGLPDKDRFNSSKPFDDAQFLKYVTNPTLPVILNVLFGAAAIPPATPRNDLVATFLTGVKGLNQPLSVHPAEMMRLNTSIAPTPAASQNDLGVLGGDLAGFPNGRRPYDDVTDIELRVAMGALCGKIGTCGTQTSDPNKGAPYTDGARAAGADAASARATGQINLADTYLNEFPYLNTPLPGSPNGMNGIAKN
jgi:Domain of unknown function (DUF4331)